MSRRLFGITDWQAAMLLATSLSVTGHVIAIPLLLETGGRDAWIAILAAVPAGLLSVWAMAHLARQHPGKTLFQYLPEVIGKVPGKLLALPYLALLALGTAITLRNMTDFLVDSFVSLTPPAAIILPYLLLAFYGASAGIVPLVRLNQFLFVVVSTMGFYAAITSAPSKEYSQLLPILADGFEPVWQSGVVVAGILGEFFFLMLLAAHVRGHLRTTLLFGTVIYITITILGPTTAAIAQWGEQEAIRQAYPAYQGWRLISLARFIERIDLIAVHQWVAGAFPRVAFLLFALGNGGMQVLGLKQPQGSWHVLSATLLVAALTLWALPDKLAADQAAILIYYPAVAILGLAMPVGLALIAIIRRALQPGNPGVSRS